MRITRSSASAGAMTTASDWRIGRGNQPWQRCWSTVPAAGACGFPPPSRVQLYTGNFLDGRPHGPRSSLCLETQALPDSPNQPGFPSAILHPGAVWRSTTVLDFRPAGA